MNTYCYNHLDNDCLQLGHVFWVEHVSNPHHYQLAMTTEPHLLGFYNKMKEKEIKEN